MRFLVIFALMAVVTVSARSEIVTGTVIELATSSLKAPNPTYGGCYAKINTPLSQASISAGCSFEYYASFDCNGETGSSKNEGNQKFSMAQLAYITGETVLLDVNPAKILNGICVAERVIMVK